MSDSNWIFPDIIYTDVVNGFEVQNTDDTFYKIVHPRIEKIKNTLNKAGEDYHSILLKNKSGTEYLQLTASPGGDYGNYFTIGYINKLKRKITSIGTLDVDHFEINDGVQLGDSLPDVWAKRHLAYFRRFSFKGTDYFYFEKGIRVEIPMVPGAVLYYKFRNKRLIEIGFGTGFQNVNPLLRMEE